MLSDFVAVNMVKSEDCLFIHTVYCMLEMQLDRGNDFIIMLQVSLF